ncbi:hypothetical protein [Alteromonas halophila]|uniref:Uncharacterized protein n=1 Tax=Alteromonas halophila TaxID=516698 RepID=A0A918MXE5_9ALTE|nr:hypothetical protein [Alteromonas halophila]GGW82353.1 hypothetical protein GCM10007391_14240 [Alteromonas halophila]
MLFKSSLIANEDTDIIVDGDPRSGNSYAVDLINWCFKDLKIAQSTHSIDNVRLGNLMGKPTIVLIREPVNAKCSLYIGTGQPISKLVENFINFHKELSHYESIKFFCFKSNSLIHNEIKFPKLIAECCKYVRGGNALRRKKKERDEFIG